MATVITGSDIEIDGIGVTTDDETNTSTANDLAVTNAEVALKAPLSGAALVNPSINGIAQSGYTGFKNILINGGFDVWQRGTSFTATSGGVYTADRWIVYDSAAVTSVTNSYSSLFNYSTLRLGALPATTVTLRQKIEGGALQGKTVTVSFQAACTGTNQFGNISFRQRGGTDSSVTTIALNTAVLSNWSEYSVTTTLPIDSDSQNVTNIDLDINITGDGSSVVNIANIQLEEGSVATPFEQRPIGSELIKCQRYYETGDFFRSATVPATTAGASTETFNVVKRATPTMTKVMINMTNWTDALIGGVGETSFWHYPSGGTSGAVGRYKMIWTADAEL